MSSQLVLTTVLSSCTKKNMMLFLAISIIVCIMYYQSLYETQTFVIPVPEFVYTTIRYPIPKDQCPKRLKDCSRRVLQRNDAKRWIAIWLPSQPEVDVSHLTRIPGWKTVVVGDGFCPRGCRFPNCVFLDPASQSALGSSLAPLLPPNDPLRKNLAYLYAIKQGAQFIYDTNINIQSLHNLTDFYYGNTSGLVYTGQGIFNYYKHYGEHWFRTPGFVNLFKEENDSSGYVLSDIPQPEVQYGLVEVKDKPVPRFQSVVPTVFTGSQSFAPFDSSNTMFHKRAFWGLFTFPGPKNDILRSYVIQTLLKYIQGYVGFLHPNAKQVRVTQQGQIHREDIPEALVRFLYEWRCNKLTSLGTCLTQLTSDLRTKYLRFEEFSFINAWLSDLKALRYSISDINVHEPVRLTPTTNSVGRRISYNPVVMAPTPGVFYKNNPDSRQYQYVQTFCENFSHPSHVSYQFDDILLIVTFNYVSLYKNMMYVEGLYRRYFPHILFCGPDVESFRSAVTSLPVNSSIAYVSGIERGWMYFQDCTVHAMKMNFNVRGYLQIGEDTLVNSWNLKNFSRDHIWFISKTINSSRDPNIRNKPLWYSWYEPYGKSALNKTFTHIETIARQPWNTKEKRFYNQYMKNVGSMQYAFHQTCDFFYIPNRLKEEFIYFTKLFFKSTLLVEAAIPTMILGLDDEENIERVTGIIVWAGARDYAYLRYKETAHYLHAFKGIAQMKVPNCKKFLCESFLPRMTKGMVSDYTDANY